jgi:uncharacterized membrane protein
MDSRPAHKQQASVSNETAAGSQRFEVTYESSLPPPADLKEYAALEPTIPERYMVAFEGQIAHRHAEETKAATRHHVRSLVGMGLGFALNLACYGLAAWFAYNKLDGASIAAIITAMLSTVGIFANTRKRE